MVGKSTKQQVRTWVETLLSTGTLSVGAIDARYVKGAKDGLVIAFLNTNDKGGWLQDACKETQLSFLGLTVAEDDFSHPDLSKIITRLADETAETITLCGVGAGAGAAVMHVRDFTSPRVIVFDAPATQAGYDLGDVSGGYAFYDPFYTRHVHDFSEVPHITSLKGFALMANTVDRLWRMKHLQTMMPAALAGDLDPGFFYRQIRNRKNYRFYRSGIEHALSERGQLARQKQFRTAFRARMDAREPGAQFKVLQEKAQLQRPSNPDAWVGAVPQTVTDWPSEKGNVWMLDIQDDTMRYMSDRWDGVTLGYEERGGITLAQTPPMALGVVHYGQGAQVARDVARPFIWHVVGSDLSGAGPQYGARSEASVLCAHAFGKNAGLHTVMAFNHPAPGLTVTEAGRATPAYDAVLQDITHGQAALRSRGKSLLIDRVRLSLLSGQSEIAQMEAVVHYATVAAQLCEDIPQQTGQITPPTVVVIQGAGSRVDGTSEVILAEGRVDIDNPALPCVVASPAYPWPLMAETSGTPSAKAALLADEMSVIAVTATQAGKKWFCPLMRAAQLNAQDVHVSFSTLDGLVLDDGSHGFQIMTSSGLQTIVNAAVTSDDTVTLTLAAPLDGTDPVVTYAWGHQTPYNTTDMSANHGALRDRWQQASVAIPGQTLHRYALSARVPITRASAS